MSENQLSPAPVKLLHVHHDAPICSVGDGPLSGLRHRTVIDHNEGAASLALWQEEHLSGFCVPPHLHDCEEIITVIRGEIEATIRDEVFPVLPEQSIIIPAWWPHGFRVVSSEPVRLLALFSSNNPGIYKLDGSRSTPPWEGGASDHLDAG